MSFEENLKQEKMKLSSVIKFHSNNSGQVKMQLERSIMNKIEWKFNAGRRKLRRLQKKSFVQQRQKFLPEQAKLK